MSQIDWRWALPRAGAPVDGVFQVETATCAGTVTTAGNATVIVTAAGMTGSPITLAAPVALTNTANAIATAVRAAMNANAVVAAFFTISGATDQVIATRTSSAANDTSININIADGTSVGVTTAASSANTTAGVLGSFHGADPGALLVDTTNSIMYNNRGTALKPTWVAL